MEMLLKIFAITLMCQFSLSIPATLCNTTLCTEPRGYIRYEIGNPNTQWTITTNEYTNFVVIVRNIGTISDEPWGTLIQYNHLFPFSYPLNRENRLFKFENTRQVVLTLQGNNVLLFRLEYYAGCNILEDRNNTIIKKPVLSLQRDGTGTDPLYCSNLLSTAQFEYNVFIQRGGYLLPPASQFGTWLSTLAPQKQTDLSDCYQQLNQPQIQQSEPTSEPTCWIVIPTITDERQETRFSIFGRPVITTVHENVDVQEIYLNVQDILTNENTTLNVIDMMEDTHVMSLQGNESLSVVKLSKSNSTYMQYQNIQGHKQVSTLLFVDLTCEDPEGCSEAGFSFSSYALRQSDLDCMEREDKCRFNIGENNFTCPNNDSFFISFFTPEQLLAEADVDTFLSSSCPAYQLFISSIDAKLNEIDPDDITGRAGKKKKYKYCKNRTKFCKPGLYCSQFATEGCKSMCVLFKVRLRLCDHVHSVFA